MTIQHQPCPRCHIQRTVRTHGVFLCFNCHYHWTSFQASIAEAAEACVFTPAELARLRVYRGAVQAGVYSDWPVYA